MSRAGYNLKQAFSQMGRNKGMYFTSVLAITAMMLILGLFFVAFVNVNLLPKFTTTVAVLLPKKQKRKRAARTLMLPCLSRSSVICLA